MQLFSGGKRKGMCPKGRGGYTSDWSSRERAPVHHLLRTLRWGKPPMLILTFDWVEISLETQTVCVLSPRRQSSWAALTASALTASSSGVKRKTSAPSADRPSAPRRAAWPWTTASAAWCRAWAWTWRRGERHLSLRGKVRGASNPSSSFKSGHPPTRLVFYLSENQTRAADVLGILDKYC